MAIVKVQSTYRSGESTGPTVTWSSATTAGNLLVAAVCLTGENTPNTPSGWSLASYQNNFASTYIYYKQNAASQSSQDFSFFDFSSYTIYLAEYSGIKTSSAFETYATAVSSSTTINLTTVGSTTTADSLVIGAFTIPSGGDTLNPGSGCVTVESDSTEFVSSILLQKIVNSTGVQTLSATQSFTNTCSAAAATFAGVVSGTTYNETASGGILGGSNATVAKLKRFSMATVPAGIPDGSGSVTISVTPSGVAANSTLDSIVLSVSHTYVGDLKIDISSPNGTTITLFEVDPGCSNDDLNITFIRGTGNPPDCSNRTGIRTAQSGNIASLDSSNSNQYWSCTARDNSPDDSGAIQECTLYFSEPTINYSTYNETASGGILGGSSANVNSLVVLGISGGSLCNSSSGISFVANIISSGGCFCNGSTVPSYNETASGGLVAGSSAITSVKINLATSGGVLINGRASSPTIYQTSIASSESFGYPVVGIAPYVSPHLPSGAIVGGSNTNFVIKNSLASGGIAISGTSPSSHYYLVSGGVLINGYCSEQLTVNPVLTGKAVVGGNSFVDPYFPTGGCSGSGISTVSVLRNVLIAISGGPLCSGTANNNISILSIGGVRASGSPVNTKVHEIPLFSIPLTGSQVVPANNSTASGTLDVWLNQTTNQFDGRLTHNISGTVTAITFNFPALPGANTTAILSVPNETDNPAFGSVTLTNSQKTQLLAGRWYVLVRTVAYPAGEIRGQIYHFGAKASGVALVKPYFETTSGGARLGGFASVWPYVTLGGIVNSGTSDATLNSSNIASGGELVNGVSATTLNSSNVASGGELANGVSVIRFNYQSILQTETIGVGGSAVVGINSLISGGMNCSGSAIIQCISNTSGNGSLLGGGNALNNLTTANLTSGGILLSSNALVGIGYISNGAILINGYSNLQRYALPAISGGAKVYPSTILQQNYAAQPLLGGVRGGGRNIGEKIKFFSGIKRNYGLALGNNILSDALVTQNKIINRFEATIPVIAPDENRIEHLPKWCEVGENCSEGAILPKIIKNRQKGMLPDKSRQPINLDNGIARIQ